MNQCGPVFAEHLMMKYGGWGGGVGVNVVCYCKESK